MVCDGGTCVDLELPEEGELFWGDVAWDAEPMSRDLVLSNSSDAPIEVELSLPEGSAFSLEGPSTVEVVNGESPTVVKVLLSVLPQVETTIQETLTVTYPGGGCALTQPVPLRATIVLPTVNPEPDMDAGGTGGTDGDAMGGDTDDAGGSGAEVTTGGEGDATTGTTGGDGGTDATDCGCDMTPGEERGMPHGSILGTLLMLGLLLSLRRRRDEHLHG
jgi:hypothetical protein